MPTYFVLQPASWQGADAHLCRPLVGARTKSPDVPWVSVARSRGHGELDLVRCDEVSGEAARALLAEAQAWLDGNQRQWQVIEQSGFLLWKKPSMVRAINPASAVGLTADPMDDLSSEQLLSARAMLEATNQLGTPSMPRA